jgi:hypothetical protein
VNATDLAKLKARFPISESTARRNSPDGVASGAEPVAITRNRLPWSKIEDETLIRYYANTSPDLFSLKEIAEFLKRTTPGVAKRAGILGISRKRNSPNHFSIEHCKNISEAQKLRSKTPEEQLRRSVAQKAWLSHNEHPRGFKGHKRTELEKSKIAAGAKKMWADPASYVNSLEYRQILSDRFSKLASRRTASESFSRCKRGLRSDLGLFFRSAWEANYARYLNWLIQNDGSILKWEYEAETFWFKKIRRGVRSWLPDFKVWMRSGAIEYHEVKGWMYPKSKTALKRMAIYYPATTIVLIDRQRYQQICKQVRNIVPNWE